MQRADARPPSPWLRRASSRQPLESRREGRASQLPRLRSLLVSHKGQIVLERYFNGARAAQPANIKSASKSVISALVGIAVSRGLIKSVDQKIADYFPELASDPEPRKRDITIEDLLTMRSGLESTSGRELRRVGAEPELGALRAARGR